MSSAGEVENTAVEKPTEEAPPAEQSQPAEKPVKERKLRAPKERKPKPPKAAAHPPYFQMIKEALLALNEKSGSSPYAIAKYMEEKHKAVLPANFRKMLGLQLKNSAARGKLIKIKASYKLLEVGKEKGARKGKKEAKENKPKRAGGGGPRAKRAATKKKLETEKATRKVGPRKTRKSTPAKAKLPKSIKSPAAKKAKKAAA